MSLSRSFPSRWPVMAILSAALAGPLCAHAALFGDDEARRAILQMREQRAKDNEAQQARMEELGRQVDQLKRSLLDMHTQIEQLRLDLARQRGQEEVLQRELSEMQRRQTDLQGTLDERVRRLEPQPVTLDGQTFQVEPDEKRAFDEAIARMRASDFAAAAVALNNLLKRYPNTGYRHSAQYWLGNAHYGLRDYTAAIGAFRLVVDGAPEHPRAPEALLSVANCQVELKDAAGARRTLEQLVKQYPRSEAAQAARDRLLTMAAATPASAKTTKAAARTAAPSKSR